MLSSCWGGSTVFSAGSAAPGAGAQPDVTLRCTPGSHLCWQSSKDRSEQRLSARAVLIGGSCSLKRLLNNVKKLCRIFKSLLSEPGCPCSALSPTQARWCHFVTLLAQKQLYHGVAGDTGQGTRLCPHFSPEGGWWWGWGDDKGCPDPPSCRAGPAQSSYLCKNAGFKENTARCLTWRRAERGHPHGVGQQGRTRALPMLTAPRNRRLQSGAASPATGW